MKNEKITETQNAQIIAKAGSFSLRTTGAENPWSLLECVKMLIFAADKLLHRYDYDGGKHEEIYYCINQAQIYIDESFVAEAKAGRCERCAELERTVAHFKDVSRKWRKHSINLELEMEKLETQNAALQKEIDSLKRQRIGQITRGGKY